MQSHFTGAETEVKLPRNVCSWREAPTPNVLTQHGGTLGSWSLHYTWATERWIFRSPPLRQPSSASPGSFEVPLLPRPASNLSLSFLGLSETVAGGL